MNRRKSIKCVNTRCEDNRPDNHNGCRWKDVDICGCLGHLVEEHKRRMTTNHKHLLSNLLAVIHRDGGHYEDKYGTEKAVKDAIDKIAKERQMIDHLGYNPNKWETDQDENKH